jgi:hypothetical protein
VHKRRLHVVIVIAGKMRESKWVRTDTKLQPMFS